MFFSLLKYFKQNVNDLKSKYAFYAIYSFDLDFFIYKAHCGNTVQT